MLSGLVGWAVRHSHRAWWAYCKSRGDYKQAINVTLSKINIYNNFGLHLCWPWVPVNSCIFVLPVLKAHRYKRGILQISRLCALLTLECESVWSLHLKWLEMHKTRELGKVMNRSALSHHPMQAFSMQILTYSDGAHIFTEIISRKRSWLCQPKQIAY